MKFTCEKSALSEAVMSAMRAVSLKSTIEALEGILVAAENGAVSVTGYDLESGICTTIEAAVEQEGRVVLGARTLSEMVRKLPEGNVSVYTDDKLVTQIRCGLSESSLMGIDAGEYPDLPQVQGKATLKLSFEALRNIVRRTAFAVAVADARPILTGVLLTARGGRITAVAVDGFRLGLAREKLLGGPAEQVSVVVPGKSMSEIGKIIRETDEELTLDLSDKHLRMSRGNVTFVCRLLEGDFINYESVIPAETSTETVVDTALLIDSIERASVVINEKMRSPIILRFEETGVGVSCVSSLGKVIDRVHAVTKGPELELGVNNRYILDALKACETQGVRVCMQSSLSPMMILPLEGDDFLFIVVPMRYNTDYKRRAKTAEQADGGRVCPARTGAGTRRAHPQGKGNAGCRYHRSSSTSFGTWKISCSRPAGAPP